MDWIRDHLQIVVIVLLALGSWIKSRMDAKAAEQQETYEPEPEPPPMMERRREPSVPPPLVIPSAPPRIPMAEYEKAREAAETLKHQQDLEARLREIRETKANTSGGAAVTRARVASKRLGKPTAVVPVSLRSRLRDQSEVRRAIVMREILDPPLGLR